MTPFERRLREMAEAAGIDIDARLEDAAATPALPEAIAEDLKDRFRKLGVRHELQPGDLVRMKPGLGYGPMRDGPLIVVIADPGEATGLIVRSRNVNVPKDPIVVGFIDNEGDFVEVVFDRARFEPWTPPAPPPEPEDIDIPPPPTPWAN